MVFGTSLRVAADASQPLNRRVANLVNAVEKFGPFGFQETFEQLHRATGSTHADWTPEQVDLAVALLGDAHSSWATFADVARRDAHARKREPGYEPLRINEVFRAWSNEYFDAERRALWRLERE